MEITSEINAEVLQQGAGMLVFVPGMLENVGDYARQVYNLAIDQQRWVLYLPLDFQGSNQLAGARQLATLTALTQGSAVKASALQARVDNWTEVLPRLTHPGDLVLWPEERWLAPADLEKALGITQLVLPAAHTGAAPQASPWFYSALIWLLGLVVIVGFSYFEITLAKEINGPPMKLVLISLFLIEAWLLYKLNQIFG